MLASIIFNVVIIAVMVWCGRFTAKYAVQRGRSRRSWFLLGALFFPIPSIVLALLPPRSHAEAGAGMVGGMIAPAYGPDVS